MKRTKIVATIGPASESEQTLSEMISAGLDVARFNFSHGEHAWHDKVMNTVRSAATKKNAHTAILADLQGPRVRTRVEEDTKIAEGQTIVVTDIAQKKDDVPVGTVITLDCPHMCANLKKGHTILIEDGLMRVQVSEAHKTHVLAEVIDGGVVKNHKGVNIPEADIPLPTLTNKDLHDLSFALHHNVDFVGLSFVRSAKDIEGARAHMKKILGADAELPHIISKIECKKAIENLDEIIAATDGVMVARGDLGIEMEPARVTLLQKDIIAKSMSYARPVIVATQMLQSMVENARPTRAEVSDVTNAVIDHTDAVMLSAESSTGAHPVSAVKTLADIAANTEISSYDDVREHPPLLGNADRAATARGAVDLAKELDAKIFALFSKSGDTARFISHFRQERTIFVATDEPRVCQQLSLVWGVRSFLCTDKTYDVCTDTLVDHAKEDDAVVSGDTLVRVIGTTPDNPLPQIVGSTVVN